MTVRVRFAPSPTGKVHIGNIRAAIFNWLFAKHENGKFLVRVEDTDIERSTPEAIQALFEVLTWLKIDFEEEVMYQTTQSAQHLTAAKSMIDKKLAYFDNKGGDKPATIFRFPYDADQWIPGCTIVGDAEIQVLPEEQIIINKTGINWAIKTKSGKVARESCTLAGMKSLQLINESGDSLFDLDKNIDKIINQEIEFAITQVVKLKFTRRQITYTDIVKGDMSKPLDSLKDFVIVRSDGTPVFHISNVVDDITQNITHIIRGDDHVENTFKHLFLFSALGTTPPKYGHLPMIVNAQGKPYSKRDGDAFVGDFKDKGFLPNALFNYLSLLGWSPGDNREKMTRTELIEAFTLERTKSAPAQMDMKKLENLNGMYISEIPFNEFVLIAETILKEQNWDCEITKEQIEKAAKLMQIRTHRYIDIPTWKYFFTTPDYNENAVDKSLRKNAIIYPALQEFAQKIATIEWNDVAIEAALKEIAETQEVPFNKLTAGLRFSITGTNSGACLFATILALTPATISKRINETLAKYPAL